MDKQSNIRFCNLHSSILATHFCLDHNCIKKGSICYDCTKKQHQEHESIFKIEDIYEFLEEQVCENIKCPFKEDQHQDSIEDQIRKKLDQILSQIKEFEEFIMQKTAKLKKLIKKEQESLKEKLYDIFEFRELFKASILLSQSPSKEQVIYNIPDGSNQMQEQKGRKTQENNIKTNIKVQEDHLLVSALQGVCVDVIKIALRDQDKKEVQECKKFLNENNQKLHIKDFRLSSPEFLQSLILKKLSFKMKLIANQCSSLLNKITDQVTSTFYQSNHFEFKILPNHYLEENCFSLLIGEDEKQSKQQNKKESICQQNLLEKLTSYQKSLQKLQNMNLLLPLPLFTSFGIDQTAVGNKIQINNFILEQKGILERYCFLKPTFNLEQNQIFKCRVRIITSKCWIAIGVANKEAVVSQDQLKLKIGASAYLLALNGCVYQKDEEPIKQFNQFIIKSNDIITTIFSCKTSNSEQSLEIWLNEEQLLKSFQGNLFLPHEASHLAFCIGLLKGDCVEILQD